MKSRTQSIISTIIAAAALAGPLSIATAATAAPWKSDVSFTFKETYDSNVYLQDAAPNPAIAGARPAHQTSFITRAALNARWQWQHPESLSFSFGYAPEAVRFHAASDEDHVIHATSLKLDGHHGATVWSLRNSATWIDGSEVAPIFGGTGGAPALGGIPVRDRRAAFIERACLELTQTLGAWIVRPVITAFRQDFGMAQSRTPGYANFIDRSELLGGLDIGREIWPKTRLIAGFRWGRQQQYQLHGIDSPYDSTIRRFIVGMEGTPLAWLQVKLLAGPESRSYAPGTPTGFNREKQPLWVDASASLVVSPRHSLTMACRHQDLPASSSQSMYSDTVGNISWRSQFGEQLTATVGLALARGDWRQPAVRNDRIFTPSLTVHYKLNPHISTELGWAWDRAVSRVPTASGREFHRHNISAGCKYSF